MSLNKITLLAAALGTGLCATALAQDAMTAMDPNEIMAARENQMKLFGGTMRTARNAEGAAMVEIANVYVDGFENLADLFPEGTNTGSSKALSLIWEDWDGFLAVIEKGQTASAEVLAAAESGDQAAFLSAMQGLGPVCQECHDTYREPM